MVLQSDMPVLVDFGAPWCPPCRAIAPTLGALARDYAGRLNIVTVNIDEAPGLAANYGVTGLPTLIFFMQGKEVKRMRGAAPKQILQQAFDALLTT